MSTSRKPCKAVPRSYRIEGGQLHLAVGKEQFCYTVEPLPSDFGLAVRLTKQEPETDQAGTVLAVAEAEVYDVLLDTEHGRHGCECKGFLRWRHCKHVEALVALLAAGKLRPALEAIREEKARQEAAQRAAAWQEPLKHVPALCLRLMAVTGVPMGPAPAALRSAPAA